MVLRMIRTIDSGLFPADVVRPHSGKIGFDRFSDESAAGKEVEKGQSWGKNRIHCGAR